MTEQITHDQPTQLVDDVIDFPELFIAILQGTCIVISTTFVFVASTIFYALNLPNIYKSEALLAPVTEDAGMNIPIQLGCFS